MIYQLKNQLYFISDQIYFYTMNFRQYYQNEIPGKWGNLSYTNSWKMGKLR